MIFTTLLAIGACQGIAGILSAIPLAKFWYKHSQIPRSVEGVSQEILTNIDEPTIDSVDLLTVVPDAVDEEGRVTRRVLQRRNRTKYIATCAKEAQVEFGLLKPTESNRLMVQRFIRDRMLEHNLRHSAVAASMPLAVHLAFVPSAYHVEAQQFLASSAVQCRTEQMTLSWASCLRSIFRHRPLGFADS